MHACYEKKQPSKAETISKETIHIQLLQKYIIRAKINILNRQINVLSFDRVLPYNFFFFFFSYSIFTYG